MYFSVEKRRENKLLVPQFTSPWQPSSTSDIQQIFQAILPHPLYPMKLFSPLIRNKRCSKPKEYIMIPIKMYSSSGKAEERKKEPRLQCSIGLHTLGWYLPSTAVLRDKWYQSFAMMTEGFLEVVAWRQTWLLCGRLKAGQWGRRNNSPIRWQYVEVRVQGGYECKEGSIVNVGETHVFWGEEEQAFRARVKVSCKGV